MRKIIIVSSCSCFHFGMILTQTNKYCSMTQNSTSSAALPLALYTPGPWLCRSQLQFLHLLFSALNTLPQLPHTVPSLIPLRFLYRCQLIIKAFPEHLVPNQHPTLHGSHFFCSVGFFWIAASPPGMLFIYLVSGLLPPSLEHKFCESKAFVLKTPYILSC